MIKITSLKDIQCNEIIILDYINEFCRENNLTYYLAGGTLLGAIRHKGFIPWDNDIDISMPRPDYDKFISLLRSKQQDRFKLLFVENKNNYYYTFAKIVDTRTYLKETTRNTTIKDMGLFIDVFPIDGISDDNKETDRQLRIVNKWAYKIAMSITSSKGLTPFRKLTHFFWFVLFKMIGRERCFNKINDVMRKTPFGSTKRVISTYGLRKEKEIIDYECFSSTVDVEFEGKKYPAPVGYDKYLTQMYGDYMKLPPVEERIEPHDIEVYLKEDGEL